MYLFRFDEIMVTVLFCTLVVLWFFREPGFMPGWAGGFPDGQVDTRFDIWSRSWIILCCHFYAIKYYHEYAIWNSEHIQYRSRIYYTVRLSFEVWWHTVWTFECEDRLYTLPMGNTFGVNFQLRNYRCSGYVGVCGLLYHPLEDSFSTSCSM